MPLTQLIIGVLSGALVGLLAWRAGALSLSGAWAATLSGGLIFGLGGLPWAVLLLAFFISSSMLSRLFARRKAALSEKFSKGSQRDCGQVLANGGLGAALAVVHAILPEAAWPWVASHDWSGVSVEGLEHLQRWMTAVGTRPGVRRGMDVPKPWRPPSNVEKFVSEARKMLVEARKPA